MSTEKKAKEAIAQLESDAAKLEDEDYKEEKINSILSSSDEYSANTTLASVWDNILAMIELIKNPGEVNKKHLALCIGALAYVINPIDVIPDCIFGIGLTDDAAVVCWVVKTLDDVLKPFRIKVQERKEEKKKNVKKLNEAKKRAKRKRKHHEIEGQIEDTNEGEPVNKKRKVSKEEENESDNDEDDDLKSPKHINRKKAKGKGGCIVM